MLQNYDAKLTEKCLTNVPIIFIGDSLTRQLFWDMASRLNITAARQLKSTVSKHSNITFMHNDVSIDFLWDPYIENKRTLEAIQQRRKSDSPTSSTLIRPSVNIVLSSGLWQVKNNEEFLHREYRNMLGRIAIHARSSIHDDTGSSHVSLPIVFLPPPAVVTDRLDPERATRVTQSRIGSIVDILHEQGEVENVDIVWALRDMTIGSNASMQDDGLHLELKTTGALTNLLLNRFCNTDMFSLGYKTVSTCCTQPGSSSWIVPIAVLAFSITLSCFYYHMYSTTEVSRCKSRIATIALFTFTVLTCWISDRTILLSKMSKPVDERAFALCAAACLLMSMLSAEKLSRPSFCPPPSEKAEVVGDTLKNVLSRAQTEEWKGWMQILILLYHYFGMSKVLWVYKIARVLVASYLFLTGYGHVMYFLQKLDFSLRRSTEVLLRLNLLAYALVLVMGNNYDFYYFPGLASFWYIITYCTFWRIGTKSQTSLTAALVRIAVSMMAIKITTSSQTYVAAVFRHVNDIGGPLINTHEFLFRVRLDMYVPYLGMLLAVLRHYLEESLVACLQTTWSSTRRGQAMQACIHLTWISLCCTYVVAGWNLGDKYRYNKVHPVLSMLPILTYIILRNTWSTVRMHSSRVFTWFGRCSLETYILQYHIWLAADTKGLLRLGIFDVAGPYSSTTVTSWAFWVETIFMTSVFLYTSHICSSATGALVVWFVEACDGNTGTNPWYTNKHSLHLRVSLLILTMWVVNLSWRAVQ